MDEKKLEKILSENHAPDIDINARKRAVNLAVAEFKTAQNEEKQKNLQGSSFLSRLMGKNTRKGERTMEKRKRTKFIYGATATAMAVILVGSLSMTQMNETISRHEKNVTTPVPRSNANNFGSIAGNVNTSISSLPDLTFGLSEMFSGDDKGQGASAQKLSSVQFHTEEEVAPAYSESVEQRNEADLDAAITTGGRAIPTPVAPQESKAIAPKKKEAAPLDKWSRQSSGAKDIVGANRAAPATQAMEGESFADDAVRIMPHPEPMPMPIVTPEPSRDQFEKVTPNSFKQVASEPVSTFSSDVDTASYAFVRKSINNGRLPSPAQVRVEEMVNYFDYNYAVPDSRAEPFKPSVTIVESPWHEGRKLMHVGIKGYQVEPQSLRSNLVFLLDVSGSMNQADKLPLVKSSMNMLLDSLHPDDTVSIVTYAGHTGVVLEPTKVSQRSTIINAMNNLRAGGGTAGAAGIRLAYDMAEQNFDEGAVNRVLLATDGDFNVGITDRDELKSYIENKRDKGIFLSVLGFGMGNYNDHLMQTLAQNGNGIAAYIDSLKEAQKVLVQEARSSLFPIAKDVKFQVEFNPAAVAEYRLIGYETRSLKREDFNNDKIDAGDIGAGHSVTAIYEFVPVGSDAVTMDPLRYGAETNEAKSVGDANEYAFLKMRYKLPMESTSKLITEPVRKDVEYKRDLSDVRFAIAVSAFAQKLQGGHYTGDYSFDDIIALAQANKGADPYGYRTEFIQMVRLAKTLSR